MRKAALGLGSNLGDPAGNLSAAVDSLGRLPGTRVIETSSFYLTAPVGVPDEQPDYINAVALIETELSPRALLGCCLGIEAAMGRLRYAEKCARVIDIDLLLYEGERSDDPELTLPHPRMGERAFVLLPLAELFPSGQALGFCFADKLEKVRDQKIEKIKT